MVSETAASQTALCRTGLVSPGWWAHGRMPMMASSFSPQVPRDAGMHPRGQPQRFPPAERCPSCCWLSAVCVGDSALPSRVPLPFPFSPAAPSHLCLPQASRQPRCCPGSCFLLWSLSRSGCSVCHSLPLLPFFCFIQCLLCARAFRLRRKRRAC